MFKIIILSAGLLCLVASVMALPPMDHQLNTNPEGRSLDMATYIDANSLLMFATNQGGLAEDWTTMFGRADGLYFPYQGSCENVSSSDQHVLYSAGLFMGGKVNGEIRVAVGAFDTPEYVQGPMDGNGDPLPDNPRFKMYKITNDSSAWLDPSKPQCARDDSSIHFDDYLLWQTPAVLADGAPLDSYSNPLLKGKQTLWTVFNDAGVHNYQSYGGGTASLGIEVQELIWASDEPGNENVINIQYLFINKGGNIIDSFYVAHWADPDLGGASDDLVGCDSAHNLFFCYNADNDDNNYGSTPPAWGGQITYGLVVPSPGDSAFFNGEWRSDSRNLGMTAFNMWRNGTDPDIPAQTYGYLQGFDAVEQCPTCPYINPETGLETRFAYSGNPINGFGWIDNNAHDRRLLASCGPVTFMPGDTQQVLIRIAASEGEDRLFSLYNLLDNFAPGSVELPIYAPIDSLSTFVSDSGWLSSVFFDPEAERWIDGYGTLYFPYFYSGADYGYDYRGSLLNPAEDPLQFPEVEIRFSVDDGQYAYRYARDPAGGLYYDYAGYYEVPFTVWDTENDRQLNVAFTEHYNYDIYDSTWNVGILQRERIFIFNSDYSGTDPSNTALDYFANSVFYDADQFDILYMISPELLSGHAMEELSDGQKITFKEQTLNINGEVDSLIFGEISPGQEWLQHIDLGIFTGGLSQISLNVSNPAAFRIPISSLDFYQPGEYNLPIWFTPSVEGQYEAYLDIEDNYTRTIIKSIKLIGETVYDVYEGPVWHVAIDGDDESGDGSEGFPFATIQHGIDMADAGDTILVHDGTFTGEGNRDIDMAGKMVAVRSDNGAEFTTIDCGGSEIENHRAFYFHSGEDTLAVVSGFTIQNGYHSYGGAIRCTNLSFIIFNDCIFQNNTATSSGGAINGFVGAPLLRNCRFENNHANYGGVIRYGQVGFYIDNCQFRNNSALRGGVLDCEQTNPHLSGCEFVGNSADMGGSLFIGGTSNLIIESCTFYNDSAGTGASIFTGFMSGPHTINNCIIAFGKGGGGAILDDGNIQIACTDIFGNTGGDWTGDIADQVGINGNFGANPLFCDAANSDFHLADISPCAPASNECTTVIGAYDVGCTIRPMFIEPEPIYMMFKYAYGDSMAVEVYLPQSITEYSIFDINLSTVMVNGIASDEVFTGNDESLGDYLKATVDMVQFIDSYPLLWDESEQEYSLSGQLNDETPFEETALVIMIGHRSGDVNLDGRINIMDISYLISYIYQDGPEPEPIIEIADVNGDGFMNVLDVTYLINYIYLGGPEPITPDN